MASKPTTPLRRTVEQLAELPSFLAHYLVRYTLADLTSRLGCNEHQALLVQVCRVPHPGRWEQEVAELAAFAGVDATTLAALLAEAGVKRGA